MTVRAPLRLSARLPLAYRLAAASSSAVPPARSVGTVNRSSTVATGLAPSATDILVAEPDRAQTNPAAARPYLFCGLPAGARRDVTVLAAAARLVPLVAGCWTSSACGAHSPALPCLGSTGPFLLSTIAGTRSCLDRLR